MQTWRHGCSRTSFLLCMHTQHMSESTSALTGGAGATRSPTWGCRLSGSLREAVDGVACAVASSAAPRMKYPRRPPTNTPVPTSTAVTTFPMLDSSSVALSFFRCCGIWRCCLGKEQKKLCVWTEQRTTVETRYLVEWGVGKQSDIYSLGVLFCSCAKMLLGVAFLNCFDSIILLSRGKS